MHAHLAQIANLRVETCLQRVAALESVLQLQQGQAAQLVLRLPQLLVLPPDAVSAKVQQLLALQDGQLPAVRKLVLADPKVGRWFACWRACMSTW